MGRTASWKRTSDWVESRDGSIVHAFCLDPGAGLGRLNLGDVYSRMWLDDSFVPSRPNTWQYPQGAGANKILHSWSSFTPSLPSLSLFFPFFSGTEMGTRTGYIPAKFPIIKPYPSLFLGFLLDLDVF